MHDPVGELAHDFEARVAEHAEHPTVVRQRLGDEGVHATGATDRGQVLQHDRREPAALLVVLHRERDLGFFRTGQPVVACDRDDLVAELGDERHAVFVVDMGEVRELLVGRRLYRREEPHVHGLTRQPLEEPEQRGLIVRTNGSEMDCAAVGEDDV